MTKRKRRKDYFWENEKKNREELVKEKEIYLEDKRETEEDGKAEGNKNR